MPASPRQKTPARLAAEDKQRQREDREDRALSLRVAGGDYATIARQLGYQSPMGAHKAVTRALRRQPAADAADLRAVDGAALDRAQVAIWQRVINGDLDAIAMLLRILARRARLFGLDAPEDLTLTITLRERVIEDARRTARSLGLDESEAIAEVERYLREQRV